MKKILLTLTLVLFTFSLFSCGAKAGGESITFDATSLGTTAVREEKTIKIKNHEFIYYNVCSDEKGNFILQSSDAWISNRDIQFGVRFKYVPNVLIYDTSDEDNLVPLEPIFKDYENGDCSYKVNFGFVITQGILMSSDGSPYNIGKITHWC